MAERRARRGSLPVYFDYTFDRLRGSKLAQTYDILVPKASGESDWPFVRRVMR